MGRSMKDKSNEDKSKPGQDETALEAQKTPVKTETSAADSDSTAAATEKAQTEHRASDQDADKAAASGQDSRSDKGADAASKAAPREKKHSVGFWIGVLAFLLALCALLTAGWGYHRLQLSQERTQALLSQLENTQNTASAAQQQAQAAELAATRVQGTLSSQQQNVNELQDRLTRAMKQVSKLGTDKRKDWLLAEVEYLLRLANQRVLMEKSATGALALLKSADEVLRETDDVSIYNVRKALARDIARLEAVPRVDIDGIFVKLAALNEQVDELKMLPVSERHQLPKMINKVTPESVSETWGQSLEESWDSAMEKLGKLVIIQQRDEPIEPLLSPEQVYFLQQNLHLMLEQSQLSLLQGHQPSYDVSLDKASEWIKDYFLDDATRAALLKGLNEVKGVEVAPQLPDISGSLKALKSYLEDVHSSAQDNLDNRDSGNNGSGNHGSDNDS